MLRELTIRNFALIEELNIDLKSGLTVLTGETGAGKSIIIDAVSMILGGKADKGFIRNGEKKAYIEAAFCDLNSDELIEFLKKEELFDGDDELILSREISLTGKSLSRVNGVLVPISSLKELAAFLMEIHGQHDYHSLLSNENHLKYLESLADNDYFNKAEALKEKYLLYKECKNKRDALVFRKNEREERLLILNKQFEELSKANLKIGELGELMESVVLLRNADKIKSKLEMVYDLYIGEDLKKSALSLVLSAKEALDSIAAVSKDYDKLRERLENAYYELEDIAYSARDYLEGIDGEFDSLEKLEERIDLLKRLEKKYSMNSKELIDKRDELKKQIESFENLDSDIDEAEHELKKSFKIYHELAGDLSDERKKLKKLFETSINKELHELNMKSADFVVELNTDSTQISPLGYEKPVFLISANKGEDYKELSKTASGGELSRIMLAIKTLVANRLPNMSMVFDEIDSGISGETAQIVAEKLALISRKHQVLCVTHMQQLASMGDQHIRIYKQTIEDRTKTFLKTLSAEERIEELARIIGKTARSENTASEHAKNMLLEAENFKLSLQ